MGGVGSVCLCDYLVTLMKLYILVTVSKLCRNKDNWGFPVDIADSVELLVGVVGSVMNMYCDSISNCF